VLYTVLGYILFIFTTKLDLQFNIIIFMLLLSGFLYEYNATKKEEQINNDPVLTNNDKKTVINKQKNNQVAIVIGTIIMTLIGTYLYMHRKQVQHGGAFSYATFFLQ
jgi:hypothetical protein